MIENYKKYLDIIQNKLDIFFAKQKEYIFCNAGCSKCCQNAQFPYSEIEYEYLLDGYKKLPKETQEQIKQNAKTVLKEKQNFDDKSSNFKYKCPFLINNSCACYEYRGIVCRTFGLLSMEADDKNPQMPFCILEGLNYSNVYDKKTNRLSTEKFKQLNLKNPPTIFNIDYKTLTDSDFEKCFNFKFGKISALIDHIENKPLP